MNTHPYAKELEIALLAVSKAAKLCEQVASEPKKNVIKKPDQSPVTMADFGSQALICRTLYEHFPGVSILAEEETLALTKSENAEFLNQLVLHVSRVHPYTDATDILNWISWGQAGHDHNYFWALDPVDGTKGFLRNAHYAISLCLLVEGAPKVAALACPRLENTDGTSGVILAANKGTGAFRLSLNLTGKRESVAVSAIESATDIRFIESVEPSHSDQNDTARIASHLHGTRSPARMDSQAKYATVAQAQQDAYLCLPTRVDQLENIWDHAGGALVLTEAGGRVTDLHGEPLNYTKGKKLSNNSGVVATNGLVHDAILTAISELKIGRFS